MIQLNNQQNHAIANIVYHYWNGDKLCTVIMPPGSGKTLLSIRLIEYLLNINIEKPVAYIVGAKVLEDYIKDLIRQNNKIMEGQVLVFTRIFFEELLSKKAFSNNQFGAIIIDEIFEIKEFLMLNIVNYFECFKVGFTRDNSKQLSDILNKNIVYQYTISEAIKDGYYIEYQKFANKNAFSLLKNQIEDIKIGSNWTEDIKETILEQINYIKDESSESLKVQELLISGKINATEIIELSNRKDRLKEFERLLNDDEYFDNRSNILSGAEAVWQNYFENNQWIFGFGLNFVFNATLEGKKLEQVVEGHSITGNGKRTDALLRTTGLIQSLCFGEIKTHKKNILKRTKNPYRPDSWIISEELAGAISQIQKTIQKSLKNINTALSVFDNDGFRMQDPIYLYKPKSFLIIGSLKEFKNENDAIHEEKFASFELFRRSISDIEIITFDELFERANAIVLKQLTNN